MKIKKKSKETKRIKKKMKPTVHHRYDRAEDLEEGKKRKIKRNRYEKNETHPSLSVRPNRRPKKGKLKK